MQAREGGRQTNDIHSSLSPASRAFTHNYYFPGVSRLRASPQALCLHPPSRVRKMRFHFSKFLFLVFLPLAISAQLAPLSPDQINGILKAAASNGDGWQYLRDYTYTRRAGKQKTDKNGQIKDDSTTYEIFYLLPDPTKKRSGYAHIKTHENGIALPDLNIEKERKILIEDEIEREKKLQKISDNKEISSKAKGDYNGIFITKNVGGISNQTYLTFNPQAILKHCNFTKPRFEKINERETLLLDWTLNPTVELDDGYGYLSKLKGVIAIDWQDHFVVRIEAFPKDESSAQPAAYFEAMQLPDGFWITKIARVNGANFPKVFGGNVNQNYYHETSNYKKFTAEINEAKIKAPDKK